MTFNIIVSYNTFSQLRISNHVFARWVKLYKR